MMTTPAPLLLKEGWLVSVNNAPFCPAIVPALVTDPTDRTSAVTYRNTVTLPEGVWEHCSLLLKGARFCPEILINGRSIAHSEGGMGQLTIPLEDPDVFPGNTVTLEIRLSPLEEVPVEDASRIPDADWWRSNVSSLLWDEVQLLFFAEAELIEAIPFTDFAKRELTLRCKFRRRTESSLPVTVSLTDGDVLLALAEETCVGDEVVLKLQLDERCPVWSPDSPNLCRLQIRYGSSVFYNCPALETIYYLGSRSQWLALSLDQKMSLLGKTVCAGSVWSGDYEYELSEELGGVLVPVGDRFAACHEDRSDRKLYKEDNFHPSEAGSRIAAEEFFKAICG